MVGGLFPKLVCTGWFTFPVWYVSSLLTPSSRLRLACWRMFKGVLLLMTTVTALGRVKFEYSSYFIGVNAG